jgi:multiple sugar transport system substrate-binding protein
VFALVSVAAFAGGQKAEEQAAGEGAEPVTITYWNLFTGGDGEFMSAMIEDFNASHPNITVDELTIEWDNYYPKFTTAVTGGQGPDVAICHYSRLARFIPKNAFQAVDEHISAADVETEDFVESVYTAGTYEGRQYALPLDSHPLILYYNRDLFEEAGLMGDDGEVQMAEGLENFVQMAQTLKEETGEYAVGMEIISHSAMPVRLLHGLVKQQNGDMLNAERTTGSIDAEELRVFELYDQMFNELQLAPNDVDYEASMTLFKEGRIGMLVNGVWATGTFEDTEGLNFGAMPLPRLFERDATWTDSHMLVFPNRNGQSQRQLQASVTFASWLSKEGFKHWAQAGHVPVRQSVRDAGWYQEMDYRPDYAAAIDSVHYVPFTEHWLQIEDIAVEVAESVNTGQTDPQAAVDRLQREIDRILE